MTGQKLAECVLEVDYSITVPVTGRGDSTPGPILDKH